MDIFDQIIIFFVGLVVSVLSTLIGGSSLFTIPTLILLGLSPHCAIGTDRFGIMGVCSAGWYKFHQKKLIDYRIGLALAIPVFFGAFIGANLVFEVSESVLKLIIIMISIISLAFLVVDPTRGYKKQCAAYRKIRIGRRWRDNVCGGYLRRLLRGHGRYASVIHPDSMVRPNLFGGRRYAENRRFGHECHGGVGFRAQWCG